jgi:GTPase SAR1 family protein
MPLCGMAKTSAPVAQVNLGIKSASDAQSDPFHRILLVGATGSGKTSQIWTLPGRKLVYVFDPNTMQTLHGCPDCDIIEFLPDFLDMDATLKGFNKGAKSDKPSSDVEPLLYHRFVDNLNAIVEGDVYKEYDWLCFDSLTFVSKAVMDRQLYINNRYGGIEDIADYRVVGSKLADVFNSISGLSINTFATGHLSTFQDDKTKKISTQIWLPGKARNILPLTHTNVWLAQAGEAPGTFEIQTTPEAKGLQEIRTSIKGLKPYEDVTIKDFSKAGSQGIGRILAKGR